MQGAPDRAVEYSVVFAALNEAATIEALVQRTFATLGPAAEVIVVDDGSSDQTATLAAAAGARVVRHSQNLGKGAAHRRGVAESSGDVVVFLDADGQDDPAEIPHLLAALGDADLVIGSRFLGRLEPGALTKLNAVGNRALTGVINSLFRCDLTDTQAGFRAIRKATFERCAPTASGFDVESDLLLAVLARGMTVTEVGVSRKPRAAGVSRLSTLRDGSRILARILARRFWSPA